MDWGTYFTVMIQVVLAVSMATFIVAVVRALFKD